MQTSIRNLSAILGGAALALAFAGSSAAGDFTGLDSTTATLYDVDSGAGTATSLGAVSGAPFFGFGSIARSPTDGTLYAIAPGPISGYGLYSIDENTNAATLLHNVSSGTAGTVGIAVDPSGNSIWVAGFVSLSFNVLVEEVNIATGAVTSHGSTAGNMAGLAFDGNGDLFTVILNAATSGILIKIDQIDAALSTAVGNTSGVDLTIGIGLTSDLGSGTVHIFSRQTSDLYTLDTTTAATALVSNIAGAGSINTLAENLPAVADFTGIDPVAGDLYGISSAAGTATNLGSISGAPFFGFGSIARSPTDGTLYAIGPGAITGYGLYSIDENTNAATLLHTISSGTAGTVGIAVDPSGNSIWVAGFVSLSFNVIVEEVNIATGAVTPHGNTGGNMAGLAFDGNGDLFSVILNSATSGILIKIDQIDAALSTAVGNTSGVDLTLGIGLASDLGSGSVHIFSRQTSDLYTLDTTTAGTTLVGNISGAGSIRSICENVEVCNLVTEYGAGCAGAGGFVPSLAFNGCPAPSASVSVDIAGGVGGAMAAILLGTGQGSTPLGSGCDLLLTGVSPVAIIVPLGGSGNGNGSVSLPATLPASLPSGAFTLQAFCGDGTTGLGFSVSNGVQVTLP
ncbi:MAG: hypothetical protein ACF8XB_11280 [Planctomycetota bacterium JB042]